MYYLYVLLGNKKNWHYIGSTDNVERRLLEHNKGKVKSTKAYRPLKVIYTEAYSNRMLARKRELFLKKTAKARIELFNNLHAAIV